MASIPWEVIGPVGIVVLLLVGAFLRFLKPILLKAMTQRPAPKEDCPISEHVATLARHTEAIATLKEGQTVIFHKFDQLDVRLDTFPDRIADRVVEKIEAKKGGAE